MTIDEARRISRNPKGFTLQALKSARSRLLKAKSLTQSEKTNVFAKLSLAIEIREKQQTPTGKLTP